VAQLTRPVNVDSVESLHNSDWGAAVVLDLASVYITPDRRSSAAALNMFSLLTDGFGVASLVAGKSELTSAQTSTQRNGGQPNNNNNNNNNSNTKSNSPAPDDALTVFLTSWGSLPYVKARTAVLWRRLRELYAGTQANTQCPPALASKADNSPAPRNCPPHPDSIELRTAPVTPEQQLQNSAIRTRAPLMRTYSALGILKNAVEPGGNKIEFVTLNQYRRIHDADWNKLDVGFYTLLPEQAPDAFTGANQQIVEKEGWTAKITEWIETIPTIASHAEQLDRLFVYELPRSRGIINVENFLHGNTVLFGLRRYILIIVDDAVPSDAYVAYPFNGKWYYIVGDDNISQNNFNLIGLFLTMMAVPPSTPPLSPSITVGGAG
jgi:hypothetical protein